MRINQNSGMVHCQGLDMFTTLTVFFFTNNNEHGTEARKPISILRHAINKQLLTSTLIF
jgi:hypothetical protein